MTKQTDKNQTQGMEPLTQEELYKYFNYILSNQMVEGTHAEELEELAKRPTTLSDVVVAYRVMMQQEKDLVDKTIVSNQVNARVLRKLGATDDMFSEANKEYNEHIEEVKQRIEQEKEEAEKKTQEDTEGK